MNFQFVKDFIIYYQMFNIHIPKKKKKMNLSITIFYEKLLIKNQIFKK